MSSLVYVHIGDNIPECLYDSLYQTLLFNNNGKDVNKNKVNKIYVIISESIAGEFINNVNKFNISELLKQDRNYNNMVEVISLEYLTEHLKKSDSFNKYTDIMRDKFPGSDKFRNGFWVSTTSRFFYIGALIELYKLENVFHIENDVIIYDNISKFFDYIEYNNNNTIKSNVDWIYMVQDSPNRVIPSIMYFPNFKSINGLNDFIVDNLKNSREFMNDMNILGRFGLKKQFPCDADADADNNTINNKSNYIFDGAAIGQYLGGVDPSNLPDYSKKPIYKYVNPSKGFINETSTFKPDTCMYKKKLAISDYTKKPIGIYICKKSNDIRINRIANLHIHSKQLYQFSSVFDYNFKDIITGDRVISLCDFVLSVKELYNNHKNIEKYAKDVILIKDVNNVNFLSLNNFFTERYIEKCKNDNPDKNIKIFIYTHMLEYFTKCIAPKLNRQLTYVIYTHNSDDSFNDRHKDLLDMEWINCIYSQNIEYKIDDKLKFLPIGIANSMWNHGNLYNLYTVMKDCYKYKKSKNIYVNINPNTYNYRREILSKINDTGKLNLTKAKNHKSYLEELSEYRFCLAIRGNGIDTHRFWESLYLGVIPVIINNSITNCNNFVEYLKMEKVPFYEIKEDDMDKIMEIYTDDFFNQDLYRDILDKLDTNIYSLDTCKLKHYN